MIPAADPVIPITPMTKMTPPARAIPFGGFRVVFALVNAALWFALTFAITTPIAAGMLAAGRTSSTALITAAAAIAFFVCFFGRSGALSGFLEQAEQGRFSLPPMSARGPGGRLARVWQTGGIHGALASLFVATLGAALVARGAVVPSAHLSLHLAELAAVIAFVEAFLAAGPKTLGDLHSAGHVGPPPSRAYFLVRFAVPQGAGNGLTTALIAAATFSGDASPTMPLLAFVGDAFATGAIIAFFMVATAGGLARVDRHFGLIAGLVLTPPSRLRRAGLILAAGALAAAVALPLASVAGASLAPYVAWKAILGAVVGGVGAILAARWQLGAALAASRSPS